MSSLHSFVILKFCLFLGEKFHPHHWQFICSVHIRSMIIQAFLSIFLNFKTASFPPLLILMLIQGTHFELHIEDASRQLKGWGWHRGWKIGRVGLEIVKPSLFNSFNPPSPSLTDHISFLNKEDCAPLVRN